MNAFTRYAEKFETFERIFRARGYETVADTFNEYSHLCRLLAQRRGVEED